MIRIIYISTARVTLSAGELEAILHVSRRNNSKVDVTGLLIVGGRRFLQALEGPSDAVNRTYERIKTDERHFATVLLSQRAITERAFGGWSMGYQPAGKPHSGGGISDEIAALIAPIEDPIIHAYFSEFAKQHAA